LAGFIVHFAKKLKSGDPFEEKTLIGPLKSQKQLLEIENLINEIVKKECVTLLYSGKHRGSILEPIEAYGA